MQTATTIANICCTIILVTTAEQAIKLNRIRMEWNENRTPMTYQTHTNTHTHIHTKTHRRTHAQTVKHELCTNAPL